MMTKDISTCKTVGLCSICGGKVKLVWNGPDCQKQCSSCGAVKLPIIEMGKPTPCDCTSMVMEPPVTVTTKHIWGPMPDQIRYEKMSSWRDFYYKYHK